MRIGDTPSTRNVTPPANTSTHGATNKPASPSIVRSSGYPSGGSGARQVQGDRTHGHGSTHHSGKSEKGHHKGPGDVPVASSSSAARNVPADPALGPMAPPLPDPRAIAHEKAAEWLGKQGIHLDPDRVHYTYGHESFGPRNQVGPSMTDIMLDNRQDLKAIDNGDWANLIGTSPKNVPRAVYGQLSYVPEGTYYDKDHQPLDPSQANGKVLYDADGKEVEQKDIGADIDAYTQHVYQVDLYKDVRKDLNDYFDKNGGMLEQAHRVTYLKTADEQAQLGSLSAGAVSMVRQAAGLPGDKTADRLSPKDLRSEHAPWGPVTVSPLRIGDRESDSALVMTHNTTGRTVLYLPGTEFPFHEFDSTQKMNQWLVARSRDPQQREALVRYFPYQAQQAKGSDSVNLNDHLAKLCEAYAAGESPSVTSAADPIKSDIFKHGIDQLRRRVVADDSQEVVSDATVHRQEVKQNIQDTLTFFDKLLAAYIKKYDRGLDG